MVECFSHDEPGYAGWLRDHPTGFVINCEHRPKASYIVLHRASCRFVSGKPPRGDTWTQAYMKVCSPSFLALTTWAEGETGGHPTDCSHCSP